MFEEWRLRHSDTLEDAAGLGQNAPGLGWERKIQGADLHSAHQLQMSTVIIHNHWQQAARDCSFQQTQQTGDCHQDRFTKPCRLENWRMVLFHLTHRGGAFMVSVTNAGALPGEVEFLKEDWGLEQLG